MEKIAAEILVKCGYAENVHQFYGGTVERKAGEPLGLVHGKIGDYWVLTHGVPPEFTESEVVEPFADTLEGRRQSDALEKWLMRQQDWLWENSEMEKDVPTTEVDGHQWRLDRIKWCLSALEE